MNDLGVKTNPLLTEFGVSFPSTGMLEMNTHVLKAPDLQYGTGINGQKGRITPTDGTWEMWYESIIAA